MLAEVAEARATLDRHAGASRGAVRVATTTADGTSLPAALAAFHAEHPDIQIALRHAPAAEIGGLVARGTVDVALAAVPEGALPGAVTSAPLRPERLRLVTAPGQELADAGAVPVSDLRGRALILAEPGTALRETVVAACQAEGFSPVPLFEVSDPYTVRSLTSSGLGISVVPASWLQVPGPPLAAVDLESETPLTHTVSVITPAAGATPAAALLAGALTAHLGQVS